MIGFTIGRGGFLGNFLGSREGPCRNWRKKGQTRQQAAQEVLLANPGGVRLLECHFAIPLRLLIQPTSIGIAMHLVAPTWNGARLLTQPRRYLAIPLSWGQQAPFRPVDFASPAFAGFAL